MPTLYTHQQYLANINEKFPNGEMPDLIPHCQPDDPIRERYRYTMLFTEYVKGYCLENGISTSEALFEIWPQVIEDYLNSCVILPTDREPLDENVSVFVSDFMDQEFKYVGQVPLGDFTPNNMRQVVKDAGREYVKFILCMSDIYVPYLQARKVDD